jgi:hypothetical protein
MASTVVASKDQVSADLAEEVVILNLRDGTYYGLDIIGARIWSLIQEPVTVGDVRNVLLEEYEVDQPRCERDLLALLRELSARELVVISNGTSA